MFERCLRQALFVIAVCSFGLLLSACNPLDSKVKAGLQVETGNVPASLFLDGQYIEKSPYIAKDLKPGTYTLKIQPDDSSLVPNEVTINLRQGLLTVVTWLPGKRVELSGGVVYELEKLTDRNATELAIISIPDGAIIQVPGQQKTFAPIHFTNLEPGEKEYEVSLPSYDSQKHTVNLIKGFRTTITVKLAKSADSLGDVATQSASISATTSTSSASASLNITDTASNSGQKVPITGSKLKTLPTGYTQNGQEGLRVRASASADSAAIGFVATGTEVPYLNKNTEGWYKISFDGQTGWVSSHYAELEK